MYFNVTITIILFIYFNIDTLSFCKFKSLKTSRYVITAKVP